MEGNTTVSGEVPGSAGSAGSAGAEDAVEFLPIDRSQNHWICHIPYLHARIREFMDI